MEGEVVSTHGMPAAPLLPLILLSQPWHLVNGAGCGPATPSLVTAAAAEALLPQLLLGVAKDIEKQGGEL